MVNTQKPNLTFDRTQKGTVTCCFRLSYHSLLMSFIHYENCTITYTNTFCNIRFFILGLIKTIVIGSPNIVICLSLSINSPIWMWCVQSVFISQPFWRVWCFQIRSPGRSNYHRLRYYSFSALCVFIFFKEINVCCSLYLLSKWLWNAVYFKFHITASFEERYGQSISIRWDVVFLSFLVLFSVWQYAS